MKPPPFLPLPRRPRSAGFTVLELMVAIFITAVMLGLVNQLFTDTSDQVSQGIALSDVMNGARAIGDCLDRDAQKMMGPGDGGWLCIRTEVQLDTAVALPSGRTGNRSVLRDRIGFVRLRGNLEPACGVPGTYSNTSRAPHVLVYYGHGERAKPDGSGTVSSNGSDYPLVRHLRFLEGPSTTNSGSAGADLAADDLVRGFKDMSSASLADVTAAKLMIGRPWVNPAPSSLDTKLINQTTAALYYGVSDIRIDYINDDPATLTKLEDAWKRGDLDCGPTTTNWPYLLRIRWRVHDRTGRLTSMNDNDTVDAGKTSTGKWFEQIIRVPR